MASASGPSGLATPDKITCRMISAPGDPPGSRVSTTPIPIDRKRCANAAAWVDLPVPSPPSKVMKRPRISASLSSEILLLHAPEEAETILHPLDAGAEQVDDHLGRGVEGALRHRAGLDPFGRLQWHFEHQGVAAPHFQGADLLTLLNR